MKIFDTHIHFNSEKYKSIFHQLINQNPDFYHNNIGTTLENSLLSVQQAKKHSKLFSSIGIHPLHVNEHDIETVLQQFHNLLKTNNKIIAIGETGLDFYRVTRESSLKNQLFWLNQHFLLSQQYNLPIILHIRNAHPECIKFLKYNKYKVKIIIHSFDGEIEDLKEYLKIDNLMISISPLLFRKIEKFKHIIELTNIDRLLIETDAPWLTENQNQLPLMIQIISQIKSIDEENTSTKIWNNSLKIFNLN